MDKQNPRQSVIHAKAIAAAKLVLQGLDPAAKKRRQLFSSGPPQGILAVHLKGMKNFNKMFFFASTLAGASEIHLYLQISVQDTVKCSKLVPVMKDSPVQKSKQIAQSKRFSSGKSLDARSRNSISNQDYAVQEEIFFDELKTFPLELSNNREDISNKIFLELFEVEGSKSKSKSLTHAGYASLHLFDLIKERYGILSIPLMVKEKKIADLELEYVFRYGIFGYGYSHQLQQNEIPVSQIMNESMFFKLNPPVERMDDDGLFTPIQVPTPNAIKRGGNADDESSTMRENALSSPADLFKTMSIFAVMDIPGGNHSTSFELVTEVNTSNFDQLLQHRNRLDKMKGEYLALKTRIDRKKYLHNVLGLSGTIGSESHSDSMDGRDHSIDNPRSSHRSDSLIPTDAIKAVIGNLSPLLLMAPSLQSRSDGRTPLSRDENNEELSLMERLRRLSLKRYSTGSEDMSQETDEEKAAGRSGSQESTSTGFMNILRKKVLNPMKIKKHVSVASENSNDTNLSDAEEGQFSPRVVEKDTNMSARIRRLNSLSPSDHPRTRTMSFLHKWKRKSNESTPTTVVHETESSSSNRSMHLQPHDYNNYDDVE